MMNAESGKGVGSSSIDLRYIKFLRINVDKMQILCYITFEVNRFNRNNIAPKSEKSRTRAICTEFSGVPRAVYPCYEICRRIPVRRQFVFFSDVMPNPARGA